MQRILFVDHTPFAGGGQLVLVDHIAALDHQLWEVHVACTNTVPDLVNKFEQAGAVVHLLDIPRLRGFGPGAVLGLVKASWKLRSLIHDHQFDVVVANTTRASYIVTLACMGTSTPIIWWVRDYLYPKSLFHLLRRRAAKIVCVSQSVKESYMSADDPSGLVLHVASNLYQQLPQVGSAQIQSERFSYGFKPDDVVVGFIGRLVEEKGPQDLIEAVGYLLTEFPQLKLLVVGSGQGQMHDNEQRLHQRVGQAGWQDNIKFAGYQSNQPLYYSLIDIFVLATRDREPYATSVVQAMMAAKPVIGTQAGGTPELVIQDQTGCLYPPGDVSALAAALRRLIGDPDLAVQLAKAGQSQVLQYNREDQLADQAEHLYQQLIDRTTKP